TASASFASSLASHTATRSCPSSMTRSANGHRFSATTNCSIQRRVSAAASIASVHRFAQCLAGLESHGGAGGDFDSGAGLRILAVARTAPAGFESAEADQTDAVAAAQRVGDFIEDGAHQLAGLLVGDIGLVG